jgi:hypothetical protein
MLLTLVFNHNQSINQKGKSQIIIYRFMGMNVNFLNIVLPENYIIFQVEVKLTVHQRKL